MVNIGFRTSLIGSWITMLAVMVTVSIATGATLATISLLLVLGIAPAVVMALITSDASPTVAEILHAADTKDRQL